MRGTQQWQGLPPDIDALEAACLAGDLTAIQRCAAWVDDPQPYTRARAAQALAATPPALWAPLVKRASGSHNPTPGWWYVFELLATDAPSVWPAHATPNAASAVLPAVNDLVDALVSAAPASRGPHAGQWMACAHHALAVLPSRPDAATEALLAAIWRLGDDALVVACATWQLAHFASHSAPPGSLERLAQVRGTPTMAAMLARVEWGDSGAVAAGVELAMQADPLAFQFLEALEQSHYPGVRTAASIALAPRVSRRFFVSAMTVRAASAGVVLRVDQAQEALVRYTDARRASVRGLARAEWVRVAPAGELPAVIAQIDRCDGEGWEDAMGALLGRQDSSCETLVASLAQRGSAAVRESIADARDAGGR